MIRANPFYITGFSTLFLLGAMTNAVCAEEAKNTSPQQGWSMADHYWDAAEMAKSRDAVRREHGAANIYFLQADRF